MDSDVSSKNAVHASDVSCKHAGYICRSFLARRARHFLEEHCWRGALQAPCPPATTTTLYTEVVQQPYSTAQEILFVSKQAVFKPSKAIRWDMGHRPCGAHSVEPYNGHAVIEGAGCQNQGWHTSLLSSIRRLWATKPAWLCAQLRVQRRQQQLRFCHTNPAAQPGAAQIIPSQL